MTPVVKNHRCTSWAKHARTKKTNDFATLDAELCKNYLLLVGNDEGLRLKGAAEQPGRLGQSPDGRTARTIETIARRLAPRNTGLSSP
jgi:hypothetical protein